MKDLQKELTKQEFINDQLLAELSYTDQLLKDVGFEHGLASLKAVAEEMLAEVPPEEE
ncbi:MAG: hypothetical protein WD595_03145 [Waddliaceae bacterium]